jgi:hypothetical protein
MPYQSRCPAHSWDLHRHNCTLADVDRGGSWLDGFGRMAVYRCPRVHEQSTPWSLAPADTDPSEYCTWRRLDRLAFKLAQAGRVAASDLAGSSRASVVDRGSGDDGGEYPIGLLGVLAYPGKLFSELRRPGSG